MNRFLQIVRISIVSAMVVGCATHRLAPGGAYAPGAFTNAVSSTGVTTTVFVAESRPDFAFFAVDSAYDLTYSTLDGVFKFERDNRELLWKVSPSIKHTLDKIRVQAVSVNAQYLSARTAYIANPIPANLGILQQTLALLDQLAKTAQAVTAVKGQ